MKELHWPNALTYIFGTIAAVVTTAAIVIFVLVVTHQ